MPDMGKMDKNMGSAARSATLEKRREELAKKKADIIYGQNTQTQAAYDKIPHRVGKIGL